MLGGTGTKMTTEEIIKQILLQHPEISREQILERLEKEKNRTGGFIAERTLMRLIATEFGVEIPQNDVHLRKLSIGHLVPSLNDVTVSGRVLAVFPPKAFKGKRSGKLASLLIADKGNMLRVVLWNDKVNLVESGEMEAGQIVRFSHGYTREDRSGKPELHIGTKSEIEINPSNVKAEDYPTLSKFATKIGEITRAHKNKKINMLGTVKEIFSSSTFMRQDSSSGKVMRFTLADKTGQIVVVAWNEKADELERTLKKEAELQIANARVKAALNRGFEVHINSATYVEISAHSDEFTKLVNLKEGLGHVNVEGEVSTEPVVRDVKTSKGEVVKIAVFRLKDETGTIWVSAWRKHADTVGKLKVGDKIVMKDVYTKRGFGENPELSTRNATAIVVL